MKKFVLLGLLFLPSVALARGREGYTVKPVTVDNGDVIEGLEVNVGTNAIQVFYSTSTQAKNYREIFLQNFSTNTFNVFIATYSTVNSSSGPRWFIPPGAGWTTSARADLWAIFDSNGANSGTMKVLGEFERDSADAPITAR